GPPCRARSRRQVSHRGRPGNERGTRNRETGYVRNVRRCVLIAILAASLAALATAQAARAPRTVTLRDSGKTLLMRKGAELQLRLTERYQWLAPRVHGTAVRLVPITFVRDPGYRAWSVRARARGRAVVSAVGFGASRSGSCDPGPCSLHL